ncbi:hypothetical protein D3C80_1675550 [compost metagenome]
MDSNDIYYISALVDPFSKSMVFERFHEKETGNNITKILLKDCELAYPAQKERVTQAPVKKGRVSMREILQEEIQSSQRQSDI